MNISKYIKRLGWVIPFAMLGGCAEDLDEIRVSGINPGDAVTIELTLPDEIVTVLSRADENADVSDVNINSLVIAQYNESGTCIKAEKLSRVPTLSTDGSCSFSYLFDESAKTAEIIANIGDDEISKLTTSTQQKRAWEISKGEKVLWATVTGLTKGASVSASLVRNYAKLNVKSEATGFTVKSYNLYGAAITGTLAPDPDKTEVTLPTGVTYESKTDKKDGVEASTTIMGLFETPASQKPFVIIEGEYKEKIYYYKAAFASRSYKDTDNANASPSDSQYPDEIPGNYTYEYSDIKRNHRYVLKIDYVNAEGWSSIEEALAAEPDNRLTCQLTDVNTEILDIIACRDYALGVSASKLSVKGEATTSTFSVVHNYKQGDDSYPDPTITLATGQGQNWLTIAEITSTKCNDLVLGDVDESGELTGTPGKKYTVTLTFDENTDDKNARTTTLTVKVGDLERTIEFTQEARDYLRGDDRNVILQLPDNSGYKTVTKDYFAWIDQRNANDFCYGIRPADNRGEERTNGLIFPPVDVYGGSAKYLIKYKDGDNIISAGSLSSEMKSFDGYDYWEITQTNLAPGISKDGNLRITNGNTTIDYVIYTTGFFHELTEEMASLQCGATTAKKGWYYYEMVQKDGAYILDRNLGAENNQPYISTYVNYYHYSGAIGGYFKAAVARSSALTDQGTDSRFWDMKNESDATIIDQLGLGGKFHIATYGDLENKVSLGRPSSGASGSASDVATVSEVTGLVKDGKIFIPHGGYYEGNVQKLPTRANIWTSTIYSEPQGFHPNYNTYPNTNYGFWYYYLDAQPVSDKTNGFSQIRCTDATQNDFSDAAVYRYMPIRLVWGTAAGSTAPTPSTPTEVEYRIYWNKANYGSNDKNQGLHIWDFGKSGNNPFTWDNCNDVANVSSVTITSNDVYLYTSFTTDDYTDDASATMSYKFKYNQDGSEKNDEKYNKRNFKIQEAFAPEYLNGVIGYVGYIIEPSYYDYDVPGDIKKGFPFSISKNGSINIFVDKSIIEKGYNWIAYWYDEEEENGDYKIKETNNSFTLQPKEVKNCIHFRLAKSESGDEATKVYTLSLGDGIPQGGQSWHFNFNSL